MEYVDPSRENIERFKQLDRDAPMHLLNQIRYRDRALYPAGHPAAEHGWTGAEAFAEYLRLVVPRVEAMGGGLVWDASFECMMTGPAEPEWDRIFVMGFPRAGGFFALMTDPTYKSEVLVHRTAAVRDSRLIRYRP